MLLKFHQPWDTPQNSITPTELTTGLSAGSDQISRPLFLHIICIQAYIPRGCPPDKRIPKEKSPETFVLVQMLFVQNKYTGFGLWTAFKQINKMLLKPTSHYGDIAP